MKKQILTLLLAAALLLSLTACGGGSAQNSDTLIYASGDYTRINPAMDEHGEINILLFNGLTAQ